MSATMHPLRAAGFLEEEKLRRTAAAAIAHSRGPGAQIGPDDDAAAVAALAALRQLGAVLTPAVRHQVHAELLRRLAQGSTRPLDLWEPDRITVALWLLELGLDEESLARDAGRDGAAVVATGQPAS
jgi:hypothetical protein